MERIEYIARLLNTHMKDEIVVALVVLLLGDDEFKEVEIKYKFLFQRDLSSDLNLKQPKQDWEILL